MKSAVIICLSFFCASQSFAQLSRENIYTDFVLYQRRVKFDKYMREKTINEAFTLPLDSNTEYRYESACWAISQFMLQSPEIKNGIERMLLHFDSLQYSTKRALLEVLYGVYPETHTATMKRLLAKETEPKLFAMEVLYLFAANTSKNNLQFLQKQTDKQFPINDTLDILRELKKYLSYHNKLIQQQTPPLNELFANQKLLRQKIIYSFQRWNRDYPGLAIIQNANGSFARDSLGKLLMFGELTRAASNLPYFITNGNTPEGIFSIQGIDISHNNFLGPTPNIQLVMSFEADSVYWHNGYDSTKDALSNYLNLLPFSWRSYQPMTEAFYAGKIGRTEIIAHGTTLDPEYFKGKPFYPFTPTLGCLCAKEIWNITTGKFLQSEQFNLVNAFLSTPGDTGYLFVINLDNKQKSVSQREIEEWVNAFEKNTE